MELIAKLLIGTVYSIFWGIVLLVVALFVLPESIFLKIIQKVKPDLISKKQILSRVRLVLDYIFNKKEVVITEIEKDKEKELSKLIKEKRLLEGNLFFLDLLKNLSSMLMFSVLGAGYGQQGVAAILEHSMEYLQYYAKQLQNTPSSRNQEERVSHASEMLRFQVNDTLNFLREKEGEDSLKLTLMTLKQGTSIFDDFMKKEYESTKDQLTKVNQILAEKFMHFIEDEAP